jgi:hypothetical protein
VEASKGGHLGSVLHFVVVALMWLVGFVFVVTMLAKLFLPRTLIAVLARNVPFLTCILFMILWGIDTLFAQALNLY